MLHPLVIDVRSVHPQDQFLDPVRADPAGGLVGLPPHAPRGDSVTLDLRGRLLQVLDRLRLRGVALVLVGGLGIPDQALDRETHRCAVDPALVPRGVEHAGHEGRVDLVVVEVGVDRVDLALGCELDQAAGLREETDVGGVPRVDLLLDGGREVGVRGVLDVDAAFLLEVDERGLELLLLVSAEGPEDGDRLVAVGASPVDEATEPCAALPTRRVGVLEAPRGSQSHSHTPRHSERDASASPR